MAMKRIAPIIDEAKKEFPKFHIIEDEDFKALGDGFAYSYESPTFNEEMVKWFLKWLGDSI